MSAVPKRAPFSRRGEQAIQANQEAALADAMARTGEGDDIVYAAHARFANARAAQSAQASNSIEKMLCHQMAAAHFSAMRHFELSANPRLPPVEVARHTNAAARLIDGYQAGCLTLQKLQSGGTQRVLVQHQQVNVGAGGQAELQ